MKFDRNTVLGFVILAILFIGYFIYTSKEQQSYEKKKAVERAAAQKIQDSINLANKPLQDSLNRIRDSSSIANSKGFMGDTIVLSKDSLVVLENDVLRLTLSTRGGRPAKVELKNYKGQDSNWVKMASSDYDGIVYKVNTGKNEVAPTTILNFSKIDSATNADGSKTISMTRGSNDSSGTFITHEYTVRPNDYLIDFNIKINGANSLLDQGTMNLEWYYAANQQESDLSYEKTNSQIGYVKDGSFDYHTIGRKSHKEFEDPVSWVGVRQRFFLAVLLAKNNFTSGKMEWVLPADSAHTVVRSVAQMKLQVPAGSPSVIPLQFYYGPSEYHILKKYNKKFEKLVNLGQGIYSFVRPINKYVILPIFDLLKKISGGSFGLAIALLTLVIKLITSPLLYKSYLSGAKMKALRPEISKLKEKYGEDRQAMSMEQMKMFREAGVNPLGGCLPALLQIPIFFALFSMFNSDIALRGADFLWSHDLAAFDAPIHLGFRIPYFGSHVSIFNLTACLTSFLISIYSMSQTPDQSNPVMKYMPYIFPVFLLFFFNQLPSALTWYYTVSNLIQLGLLYVIQNHIIDHDKILAQIEINRKKPKTQPKWQERMQQMQEQQKKLRDMQQRGKK